MKIKIFFLVLSLGILLAACTDPSNEVVIYTSVDQLFSEPILKDFEKETGIKIKAVYDTEETKSTGVLNRLIAEKDNPQCDVFWSGDPARNIVLKNKGILSPFQTPLADAISSTFKDPEHFWVGLSARSRVLIYNKLLLTESEIPHSIFDLTKEELKGKVVIANPLFGTTSFHFAAIFSLLGNEKAKAFFTELKKNNLIIATSNGDVKKRVLQGEVACGLTDTDDAYEACKESEDVDFLFLDQAGIGSLIMPNALSLIQNSPNQKNAKILIDYLLSQDTERKLAISCAQMPLHKGVEVPEDVPSLDHIIPMKIDYEKAAKKLEEIQDYLKKWSE